MSILACALAMLLTRPMTSASRIGVQVSEIASHVINHGMFW